MRRLTIDRARRIALAAQGFADPRPRGRIDVRHFRRVLSRTGLVQLDSVNVLARAHYLPFFSRLGPYPMAALDAWLWRSGELFEYWGHEASLIPTERRPWFAHRMDGGWHWDSVERLGREHPEYLEEVLEEVRRRGPLRPGEIDGSPSSRGAWWDWSKPKLALEHLFLTGRVAVAGRDGFVRLYDLPERVIPREVLEAAPLSEGEAHRRLTMAAARSLGVGTVHDLADYHRLGVGSTRRAVADLVEAGELVVVEVEGWPGPAYLDPEAQAPRRIERRALLSPFDPVVWFRPRAERLFGFRYRIEIYVPAERRVHGYYVLPFLWDGALVARVDLKADRRGRVLMVRASHGEDGIDRTGVAGALALELEAMAAWLDLREVAVEPRGDLAPALRAALG